MIMEQALQDVLFDIGAEVSISGNNINIDASITSHNLVENKTLAVYTVIVEKQVADGEITYRDVMRKVLPTPSGLIFKENWQKDETKQFSTKWKLENITNLNELVAIVFIQNTKTREIYQSLLIDSSKIATGIFEISGNSTDPGFILYPNPTTKEWVNIAFSKTLTEKHYVRIFDATGKMVKMEEIPVLTTQYQLKLNDLSGVFYIQLLNDKYVIGSKKLIVID